MLGERAADLNKLDARAVSHRSRPYLASGLLLGLSFPFYPHVHLEVFGWVWMVPLLLALKSVTSFPRFLRNVYLTSLLGWSIELAWLLTSNIWAGIAAFFFVALVMTVPWVGFYCIRQALGWRWALWSLPMVWTGWDWVYHQSDGSIGWMGLGLTQANLYWLNQYIDLTGIWGITFWLVLFNVLVVRAIEDWQAVRARFGGQPATEKVWSIAFRRVVAWGERKARLKPELQTGFLIQRLAVVTAAMMCFPLAYSAYVLIRAASGSHKEISVLMIQPNIDPWHKSDQKARAATLAKTAALTDAAVAAHKPDLIIWPETAVPYVLLQDNAAREFVSRVVSQWETPLLTGMLDQRTYRDPAERPPRLVYEQRSQELFNAAVLLTPEPSRAGQAGEAPAAGRRFKVKSSEVYHKQVLMPFVERVPYSDQFPVLSHLAINFGARSNYDAGREATTFSFRDQQGREVRVGAPICWEVFYPVKFAEFVRQGANLLTLIANEGWFSQTNGLYQLEAFTRLRSIEVHRAIARCANTGMTCLIDPWGRIYDEAPWWSATTLAGKVKLSEEMSLYARYPDYFPKACVWLSLALAAAILIRGVRHSLFGSRSFPRKIPVVQ